jgi:hypothetical protein
VTAPRMPGMDTVYVRFGYAFPSLCFASVGLMSVLAWRRNPGSRSGA